MRCRRVLGLAVACLLVAGSARADLTIDFDENGNGTVTNAAGLTVPLTSLGNQVDPFDPGNGLLPLVYDLGSNPLVAPANVLDGDVQLLETGATAFSDLVRFFRGLIIVYSDNADGSDALADVGLPGSRQGNLITLQETGTETGLNGLFGYIPGPGTPGFILTPPNGPGPATYNFTSDAAVPEPTSLALLGIGGLAIGLAVRRRSAAAAR